MSDSFADLWASSAPTKPTPQPPQKKLGSTPPPRRQQYDAFSVLSASQPSSKPIANKQVSIGQTRQSQPSSNGGDAFSDLFSPSLNGAPTCRNPDRPNMTIAERALLTQKAKVAHVDAVSTQESSSASLWDGLDALARPTTGSPRPTTAIQGSTAATDDFDFGFNSIPVPGVVPYTTSPPNNTSDDWGLSELTSHPPESRSTPAPSKPGSAQPIVSWDVNEFGSTESQAPHTQSQIPSRPLTSTPSDFDFGDREDTLLGGDDSDEEDTYRVRGGIFEPPEDDILGELSKPLSHSHSPSPNPPASKQRSIPPPRMTASPPPHITGQLVEMGFSPIDAHAALANTMTENGFDVQAAAELLLSQASQGGSTRSSPHPPDRERRRNDDIDRNEALHPRPQARIDPNLQLPSTSQSHQQSQPPQLDITADRLISQASEFGRGMFSKANALWKEGKDRAVKIYEERTAAGAANSAVPSVGRPRWMRDRDPAGDDWQRPDRADGGGTVQGGFKDDDDEQGMERREIQRPPPRRPPPSHSQPPPAQPEREREVDLFSADSPVTAYQSPFRRGKAKPQEPPVSIQSSPFAPTSSTQIPTSSSTPQRPPCTFTTVIALSTLTTSTSHKSVGTDAYKRGDFPIALAAYIRALSSLPPGHILRVPILTNVALVRSKVGELRETIKACEEAILIIRRFVGSKSGDTGNEGVEEMSLASADSDFDEKTPVEVGTGKVSVSVQGSGGSISNGDLPTSVDLVEGLSKALRRRAEALEGLEKWETARSMWEVLLGAEWAGAGAKGEAVKGIARCRRMIGGGDTNGGGSQSTPPKPRPTPHARPKPTPQPSTSLPPSAALTAVRSAHDAQQTDDAARLACKDAVDARMAAWKSSREGNIRALLTSLDETVLWPELRWRKVGMAEVVSKGQVKGAYVRAIARVHPDKLNAGNTTVEQRMIANAVFGALNEAWNVFQQQQQ